MFIFRHGSRRAAQALRNTTPRVTRRPASRIAIPLPSTPPPVPVIETCPSPTCQCRETPPGLDIERETDLNGSMAAYAEQILLCTGKEDWKSKTEDEEDAVLLRQLRQFLVRGGKYVDPYHNVLLTSSSFPSVDQTSSRANAAPAMSAFLLPSFQFVPSIPSDPESVEAFIKAFVLPAKLHKSHDALPREQQNLLLREPGRQQQFTGTRAVDEILVLICGHGGRDERCGKLGPVLRDEFEEKLQRQDIRTLQGAPLSSNEHGAEDAPLRNARAARVGLISHVGGHKWAGNVIIYIPPKFTSNALAGKGIWYGRVAPEHVEGIVQKTIIDGKVIKDLFRGGIDHSGQIIRL
ncbi:hypothetical protein CERZMDRAFT_50483 [Cercospora zeae-maydis SCOH1-5]|uniref:Altered inheritance of mitochondria protein 32 n=1 Tax=Cercospora zeae-maydis SCOH1-5 TaxID=717836 RepID=A0A6A6F3A1_9PEZI|nr:hypothetical protein CERZMDRAFT_50483 [Cercospora zeae-maydis SCOH1-5]